MYYTQHIHKMFDLKFIREIMFFMFPENTAMYKALTAFNFKLNQDRKPVVYLKCDKMDYVKIRHLKLTSYLDEYCCYFDLNRRINLYEM